MFEMINPSIDWLLINQEELLNLSIKAIFETKKILLKADPLNETAKKLDSLINSINKKHRPELNDAKEKFQTGCWQM